MLARHILLRSLFIVFICMFTFVYTQHNIEQPQFPVSANSEFFSIRNKLRYFLKGLLGAASYESSVENDYDDFVSPPGGCRWIGTAPFCNGGCPKDYVHIRSHNGECERKNRQFSCKPEIGFGNKCWIGEKHYCCRHNSNDCSIDGQWVNAETGRTYFCTYLQPRRNTDACGALKCVSSVPTVEIDRQPLTGEYCDNVKMFGKVGIFTCGLIAFRDNEENISRAWYKTTESFNNY